MINLNIYFYVLTILWKNLKLGYQSHLVLWARLNEPFSCKLELSKLELSNHERNADGRGSAQEVSEEGKISIKSRDRAWLFNSLAQKPGFIIAHILRICMRLNSKVVGLFIWQRKFQDSVTLSLWHSYHWLYIHSSIKREYKLGRGIKMYSLERK